MSFPKMDSTVFYTGLATLLTFIFLYYVGTWLQHWVMVTVK